MNTIRKKRRRQKKVRMIALAVSIAAAVLVAGYAVAGLHFRDHFFLRTEINGLEVGGMSLEEAEQQIALHADDYTLIIVDRNKKPYIIEGAQIKASYRSDGSVEEALERQKSSKWLGAIFSGNRIEVNTPMNYDAKALAEAVAALACFKEENMEAPVNADIVWEDGAYRVQPEEDGSTLILERVIAAVEEAVTNGMGELYLTDDVYEQAEITSESPEIVNAMEQIARYTSTEVIYQIADYDEKITGEEIIDMIEVGDDFSVTLDEDAITRYVQGLASKYNTYGDVREFKTTKGDTIKIGGGDYGWVIDKEAEAALLIENIKAGGTTRRQPVYSQTAKVEGLDDIGDTYIELDYTNQHLWYYVDGKLEMDADFVSGNIANGNGSPDGIFKVVYKQSPAVLVGETYETSVNFFIVFAYNVGIHDATWRHAFGGEYYRTSGSHGCINVSYEAAEELYEIVEKDTPVVAYYREKVDLTSESADISNAYSYVEPVEEEPNPDNAGIDVNAAGADADGTGTDGTGQAGVGTDAAGAGAQ